MPQSDITPVTRPSDPAAIVRDAVNEANIRGIPVSADATYSGVVCNSTHQPRWERDKSTEVVSVLGAVLLVAQPPIPDLDDALKFALGTQIEWHLGLELGVAGAVPSEALNKSPRARLAGQGYAAGAELRAMLHRRAGVPIERSPVETTDRIPYLADVQDAAIRRAAAARLLEAITVSDAIELVSELARARYAEETDALKREELQLVAEVVGELAWGTRKKGL
jgi:hypothetical protein